MTYTWHSAPLRESSSQKRSGMARVLNGSHSFTRTRTHVQSAIRMTRSCLCLPSNSRYSLTDPGGMEGWVDLGGETVYLPEGSHTHPTTNRAQCSANALISINTLPLHYLSVCPSVYLFSVSVIVLSTVVSCSIGRQLWWVFLSSSLPTVECNLTLILLRNVS